MTATAILSDAQSAGVTLWADGDTLRYRGPGEALVKLLPAFKVQKPEILAALASQAADEAPGRA